jgi:hypothetical protein
LRYNKGNAIPDVIALRLAGFLWSEESSIDENMNSVKHHPTANEQRD